METHKIKTIHDIMNVVTDENVEKFISDLSDTLREVVRVKNESPKWFDEINTEELDWSPGTSIFISYRMIIDSDTDQIPLMNRIMNAEIPGAVITRYEEKSVYNGGEEVTVELDFHDEWYQQQHKSTPNEN